MDIVKQFPHDVLQFVRQYRHVCVMNASNFVCESENGDYLGKKEH